jgi:hypothetical protein
MKRAKIILFGVIFLSAFTFAACGAKSAKESKEVEKKECCEKKDSTDCEKKCEHAKDSTGCEKKCEHHQKDSTKTE